ncbi:MAG: TolC family protein, partial [Holophagales bacterium]|nr:TolC family protein [Holophagales bacterium]
AARAELEAAELAHRASERFLSSPELTVGWQRQDDAATGKSGPLLGLSWTLPLFDRNEATRGAALARLESARARAELTARQLRAQREAASASYGELVRSAGEARAALESSARMLHAAETSFRYGELPLTDLLETQRSTTDAHLAWLELHAAALSAHRELEMLAGPSALPLPDISDFEDPRP